MDKIKNIILEIEKLKLKQKFIKTNEIKKKKIILYK